MTFKKMIILSGKMTAFGLVLWVAFGHALASSNSLNAGVGYCNILTDSLPKAAKTYALTGNIPRYFKPTHSRVWYADALGLKPVLERLVKKDPSMVENEELLRIAAMTRNSGSLEVFLAHGADPNTKVKSRTSPTSPPLLMLAMRCQRTINVVYLLAAGANIYASDTQGMNAMSVASNGDPGTQPWSFDEDRMMLLLAAGYDPRCAISPRGTTSILSLAKGLLADHEKQVFGMTNIQPETKLIGKKLREIDAILQGVTAIRNAHSPGPPRCGG